MSKFYRLRLEQQVAILIALMSLALVGFLLIGTIWIGKRQSADLINKNMTQLAGDMAASLDESMFERFRELRIMSELKPLQTAWRSDPSQVRTILHSLQSTMPLYSWIGFATVDGNVRAATGRLLEGMSVAERPWFQNGMKAPFVADVHDALRLAAYLGKPRGPEPFRFVDISMPVYDQDHKLLGVLGAHVSWTWADEVRKRLLTSADAGDSTQVWILSSAGTVLLGPDFGSSPYSAKRLKMIAEDKRGTFDDDRPEDPIVTGFAVTAGHEDYPGLGWIVITRQPMSVAYRPLETLLKATLILGFIVASLGVIVSLLIARRAAKPLLQLTQAARQFGQDTSINTLPAIYGCLEYAELSASLRALLQRVGATERLLDNVEEQAAFDASILKAEIMALSQEAERDPLTGLINRRAFIDVAGSTMNHGDRHDRKLAIFMTDIDFFKTVNDRYGHAAGDMVIRNVSRILSMSVRATDQVVRFGGEEFVMMLHNIEAKDALALADTICATVRESTVKYGVDVINVTISIGVAFADDKDEDIDVLLERADCALYEAKHRGRNCVVPKDEIEYRRAQAARLEQTSQDYCLQS